VTPQQAADLMACLFKLPRLLAFHAFRAEPQIG
jgi:hypothetical protein